MAAGIGADVGTVGDMGEGTDVVTGTSSSVDAGMGMSIAGV